MNLVAFKPLRHYVWRKDGKTYWCSSVTTETNCVTDVVKQTATIVREVERKGSPFKRIIRHTVPTDQLMPVPRQGEPW